MLQWSSFNSLKPSILLFQRNQPLSGLTVHLWFCIIKMLLTMTVIPSSSLKRHIAPQTWCENLKQPEQADSTDDRWHVVALQTSHDAWSPAGRRFIYKRWIKSGPGSAFLKLGKRVLDKVFHRSRRNRGNHAMTKVIQGDSFLTTRSTTGKQTPEIKMEKRFSPKATKS